MAITSTTRPEPVKTVRVSKVGATIRCLRPHQWIKNFIIFVPVLTAHQVNNAHAITAALWAFAAFCFCASSVYVFNDLADVESDRRHASKCRRPFAAGELSRSFGLTLASVLLLASLALSLKLSAAFTGVLAGYFAASTIYSLWVKQVALLDVFWLAALYTIRLIAGHVATAIAYSAWLLIFSMFIFLSLALMKRFLALQTLRTDNSLALRGQSYTAADLGLVSTAGLINGYLAVLVLALYVNSEQVVTLYHHPTMLLLICPLLLFWVSRIWFLAHRGKVHEDPTEFAFKDWVSYFIGALTLLVMWLATKN